ETRSAIFPSTKGVSDLDSSNVFRITNLRSSACISPYFIKLKGKPACVLLVYLRVIILNFYPDDRHKTSQPLRDYSRAWTRRNGRGLYGARSRVGARGRSQNHHSRSCQSRKRGTFSPRSARCGEDGSSLYRLRLR